MSYYLLDFENKNTNIDFTKLLIKNQISLNNSTSRMYIYYQEEDESLPLDLYIKLPKLRLLQKLGYSNTNNDSIYIYPEYKLSNIFIDFFNNFENHITKELADLNYNYSKLLKKLNGINYISVFTNKMTDVMSNTSKTIKLTDIQLNDEIQVIIKINYIWFKGDKTRLSCTLHNISLFIPQQIENKKTTNIVPVSTNTKQKEGIRFVPSINDLLNIKNNLKKLT